MELLSLTRLTDYEWDRETQRRWRLSLLPSAFLCIASLGCAIICFVYRSVAWTSVFAIVFLISAVYAIRAPFRLFPVSLRSGKRMSRYRNSDSLKSEYEILFLDEDSKTYFTHTVLYKRDADAWD